MTVNIRRNSGPNRITYGGMPVQKLYTPRDEVELLVLRTMLRAYDIPHCVTSGFGAAFPGIQIDDYTTKTILVPPGAYEEASGLIQQYLTTPESTYEPTRPAVLIQMLGASDAALLQRVAPGVFDGPVDPRWTAEFLADARHHLVVALDANEVVGMASAVHYVHPDKPPELWINEVGVAPTHQRGGVARQLLDTLLAHGRTLGCRCAWVLTDRENPPAERLYEAAGGVKEPAGGKMYTFQLNTDGGP